VSGLTPGAKLELVAKSNTPSAVSVALQIIPGDGGNPLRLTEKFPSTHTIWMVLRQFESGPANKSRNLNITARGVAQTAGGTGSGSGQLYYESPVLNIMGRELSHFDDFQKTLSQLGYNSGSVLIRLTFQKTDKTLFAAMEEISTFFKDIDTEEKTASSSSTTVDSNQSTGPKSSTTTEPAQEAKTKDPNPIVPPGESSTTDETAIPPLENVSDSIIPSTDAMDVDIIPPSDPLVPVTIFSAPTSSTPAAALAAVAESDFTPTVAHAKLHQARLLQNTQNKRLLSDRELEEKAEAEEAKIASIASLAVKVRFPDGTSAQWSFHQDDTGATLYQAVRTVMANDMLPFKLVLPGKNGIISEDSSSNNCLIKGYKLSGGVLISLLWDDSVPAQIRNQPFLKASVAKQAQQIVVPEVPQIQEEEENTKQVSQPAKAEASDSGEKKGGKMPKWLKLGKK
jgi:tether containing UBX domain for GLUT4